jgi:hypothetical protein
MPQRKSDPRLGQACPASLSIAKSAEAKKAGATQHSAKQRSQSARRLGRPWSGEVLNARIFRTMGVGLLVALWHASRRVQVEAFF